MGRQISWRRRRDFWAVLVIVRRGEQVDHSIGWGEMSLSVRGHGVCAGLVILGDELGVVGSMTWGWGKRGTQWQALICLVSVKVWCVEVVAMVRMREGRGEVFDWGRPTEELDVSTLSREPPVGCWVREQLLRGLGAGQRLKECVCEETWTGWRLKTSDSGFQKFSLSFDQFFNV